MFTGNLAEISSIRARVQNKSVVKIPLAGFKYSERNQFPSLDSIKKSAFWSSGSYEGLRLRLSKAVPEVNLTVGGDFITINTRRGTTSVSEAEVLDAGESKVCPLQ